MAHHVRRYHHRQRTISSDSAKTPVVYGFSTIQIFSRWQSSSAARRARTIANPIEKTPRTRPLSLLKFFHENARSNGSDHWNLTRIARIARK